MKIRFQSTVPFDKLYSIGFRLLIVTYALIIVFSSENELYNFAYYIALVIYSGIYYIFLDDSKYGSIIRLINDYLLITFVLFGKDFWDPRCLIFYLLPIFNFTNHTGKKTKWLPLIIVPFLSLLIVNLQNDVNVLNFIFILSFFLVYSFSFLRKRNELKPVQQFAEIENSINALKQFPNTYKLYPKLISQIRNLNFAMCDFKNYDSIICIELRKGKKARVLNASQLVYNIRMEIKFPKLENNLIQSYFIESVNVSLNNTEYAHSLVIKPNIDNNILFVFPSEIKPNSFLQYQYLFEILSPVLERFSRVIEFEQIYKNSRRKNLREIKEKLFYIRKAEKAMHFIKNKLSPLYNLIAVLQEQHIEKENVIYEDEYVKDFILKELKKSDTNLDKIIHTATVILNKENNPFTFSELEKVKPVDIFWVIENLADDFFNGNYDLEFNWDIEKLFSFRVEYNKEGLYILLTDWFSNMSKYGDDFFIKFIEYKKNYKVEFSNSYKKEHKEKVFKIESDFNLQDRKEIIRRNSHGIYQIKSTMEEMNMNGKIKVRDRKIFFTIEFKKINKNEL